MKKSQRSFVVEYKSGRRKLQAKPTNSIWGNLDLRSAGREVDTIFTDAGSGFQATAESRTQAHDNFKVETSGGHNEIAAQPDQRVVVSDPAAEVETDPQQSGQVDATSGSVLTEMSAGQGDVSGATAFEPILESCSIRRKDGVPQIPKRKLMRLEKNGSRTSGPLAAAEAISADVPAYYGQDELADLEAENRRLKRLLATKLQKENVWLREQLQRAR